MSDPLQTAAAARRARKRPRARPVEEQAEQPAAPPLVSQGARSSLPPRRRPTPDDAIRRTALELGRPRRIQL
jgi:hypothetical protein